MDMTQRFSPRTRNSALSSWVWKGAPLATYFLTTAAATSTITITTTITTTPSNAAGSTAENRHITAPAPNLLASWYDLTTTDRPNGHTHLPTYLFCPPRENMLACSARQYRLKTCVGRLTGTETGKTYVAQRDEIITSVNRVCMHARCSTRTTYRSVLPLSTNHTQRLSGVSEHREEMNLRDRSRVDPRQDWL